MAAQISQKEYLKKYLNIGSDKKKKKKKKKTEVTSKIPRTRVFDDDIDLKSLISKNNESGEDDKEDAPLVAEVIDDRSESLKRKEFLKNSQWKTVGSTGDIFQPSESLEIKSTTSYQKETVRSEHSSLSKVRSISLSNRNSLDVDKPSSRLTGAQTVRRHDSDSDQSLLRSGTQTKRRHDSDSDQSLPRSGTQTKRRHDSDSDQSLPRSGTQTKRRHDSDSDQSLPRSGTQTKRRHDSDSDQSLSRVREMTENKKRQISESENNISRRNKKASYINEENFEKQRNESSSEGSQSKTKPRHGSVGDHSPPRLKERRDTKSPLVSPKVSKHSSKEGSRKAEDVSLKNGVKERSVTLMGLKAGLQDATSLKDEIREFKRHEDEMMKMVGDKMSGKGAETVFRDRATGKKRDLKEERRKQRQEEQKKSELEEKYMEWGKGSTTLPRSCPTTKSIWNHARVSMGRSGSIQRF
ncbi:uncharacterized protein LOC143234816 isoform X2 [Tachypleus tridentatus]|uniref:uncharacterized protein LOC143234816 isoform X2 n=1 Tax=Tachypleus tridentatus TaxID=6853 RepID=UPI003FD03423